MKITLYGGKGEIGGNKILVEDSGARVLLDFGLSFSKMVLFYDDFLQPRKLNGLNDYLELGIIPDLKGLYREDFLKQSGRRAEKPEFDAVFLSHAHLDHCGNIPLINPDIPLYCSHVSRLILQALQETGNGYETEYLDTKEHFTGLSYKKVPHHPRKIVEIGSGEKVKIKNLTIEAVHVDHSVPGAFGFIIEGTERVVYTGDFRMHGSNPYTKDFIKIASSGKVDKLIIEGTRIEGEHSKSEAEVAGEISGIIKETKGLVVANFPPRDLDRLNTVYNAAKSNGRKLIVNMKTAYLIELLSTDKTLSVPPLPELLIYIPRKMDGRYDEKEYDIWQRRFLTAKNAVRASEIEQKKSVLFLDSFSFGELIDVKPVKGSSYIYSMCEPFNEEMELDHERLMHWVEHFGLKYHQAHASGHAAREGIMEMIKALKPKEIVPVHTVREERFGG